MAMRRNIALLAFGLVLGILGTVAGIRESRRPSSILYSLRIKIGAPPRDTSEANWLERRYGPERHSMYLEEWIVRDFFQDKRQGVFVDIGAADYQHQSNTWFLENRLGWSGIAVDAQESYRAGYEQHRPRTKFFALFVSDRSDDTARLFLGNDPGVSSSTQDFSASYGTLKGSIEVPTATLNDLLAAQDIQHFDFLSMDIELAEPLALAGLDIGRFKPALAVVEAHAEVRQQILDYFAANDYVVVGKYLKVDSENLWFMPRGSSVAPFPSESQPDEWRK